MNPSPRGNPTDILPIPSFFDPQKIGEVWRVRYQQRADDARQWARTHRLPPAALDDVKTALILIDVQNTFCIPDFELFVAGRSGVGAVEDTRRLCEFIYRNLSAISSIHATLDTHQAVQVFHDIYLVNEHGEHPAPLTLVSNADIEAGRWRFNPQVVSSLGISPEVGQRQLEHYTRQLKAQGKYDLTVWPYHAMLGGIGHALVSAVEEAIFFHTIARSVQPRMIIKGQMAHTESYSAIGPEVLTDPDGELVAEKDASFLEVVSQNDRVIIAGQAKSHCVAWTVDDLLNQILMQDPQLVKRVYLLEDCTSPVVVPGVIDYSDQADAAYQRFANAGMHLVRSTDPINTW
jgi:nicotinamidase-related amidase